MVLGHVCHMCPLHRVSPRCHSSGQGRILIVPFSLSERTGHYGRLGRSPPCRYLCSADTRVTADLEQRTVDQKRVRRPHRSQGDLPLGGKPCSHRGLRALSHLPVRVVPPHVEGARLDHPSGSKSHRIFQPRKEPCGGPSPFSDAEQLRKRQVRSSLPHRRRHPCPPPPSIASGWCDARGQRAR